jgi:hypothetical protein
MPIDKACAAHADRAPSGCRDRLFVRTHRRARSCPRRSIPRHTTQKQPFDVLILYQHHPQAGERVIAVRVVHHAGCLHFVIDSPTVETRKRIPASGPGRGGRPSRAGPSPSQASWERWRSHLPRGNEQSCRAASLEDQTDNGTSYRRACSPPSGCQHSLARL